MRRAIVEVTLRKTVHYEGKHGLKKALSLLARGRLLDGGSSCGYAHYVIVEQDFKPGRTRVIKKGIKPNENA